MTDRNLVEPEFVAHLFAPLDGPNAADALRLVGRLWRNCRDQLGMTQPIVEAGLTAELPADPAAEREGALAGLEDPAIQYQAVVRREHDVLNFSFAIAALDAVPRSRPRVADSSPPGWHEFTRWWRKLGGTETGALLGGATVYLAKSPDPGAVDLRAAVPEQDGDAGGWWDRRFELRTFAGWEVTPPGREPARRLVLLAGLDEDAELSRFAWSAGDTALPPLGRYLLHAAKVRYHARVRGDGQELTELRNRTARLLTSADSGGELAAAEAEVITTLAALRTMQRSVDIARSNMTKALPTAVPGDAELSEWLSDQLADDTEFLETTREQAERMRGLGGRQAPAARDSVLVEPAPAAEPSGEPPVEHRVGFGFDVVSYSSRSTPQQRQVQSRLAAMVERVLADMKLPLNRTDRQSAGDGMMVVLPADVPSHVALPALLHGWRAHLVADNAAHPADHIRLRLSVGAGPFTASAIGFSGNAIIEIGRLLDSETLRQAVAEHPDADLVALVADRLHQDVVVEGYPGL
ncbi:MAG: CATRA conflict system CASPASE/TPR repeat-associated protein, partial [Actinoplanes sp.]